MHVLSVNWDIATQVLTLGASAIAAAALAAGSRYFLRSTDKAEARYRDELASLYTYDLSVRRNRDVPEPNPAERDAEPRVQSQRPPVRPPDAAVRSLTPSTAYVETVRSNHRRLEDDARRKMAALPVEYHAQVLAQSRQSFLFSIGAAVVGFAVVVASVAFVLGGLVAPGVVGMIGAALTEAVAALFFQISNRARATMTGQLEGFRAAEELERQARERKALIEMVEDVPTRDGLLTQIVLKLADGERQTPGLMDDAGGASQ